jgi:lipoprotein-releasing system permease protein
LVIFANTKTQILNFEYFISSKIIRGQGKSFSKPIVRIAIGSIAISVMVMFIAIAIVKGFQYEIRSLVIGFAGHVQISEYNMNSSTEESPIYPDSVTINYLDKNPDIGSYHQVSRKAGIIKTNNEIEGIILKGVDHNYNWDFFKDRLIDGNLPSINDSTRSKDVLISKTIADKLKIKTGDKINTYFIFQKYQKGRALKVSGIYKSGMEEFDNVMIIGDLKQIQSLNKWKNGEYTGLEIYLKDVDKLDQVSQNIYQNIDYSLSAKSIKQVYPEIFDWLKLQDMNVIIILVVMVIVASVSMISILLILILERTNMIGILKALGSPNKGIQKIFLYQSAYIIGRGVIIGNVISFILCFIQIRYGIITLDQETYYVSTVPLRFEWLDILLLNLGTITICTLILIIPSMIISKVKPSDAIRFD